MPNVIAMNFEPYKNFAVLSAMFQWHWRFKTFLMASVLSSYRIIALHSCPGTTRGTAPWRWPTTRAAPPTTSPTPSAGRSQTGRGETCHSFVKIVTGFIWLMMLTYEVLLIRKWLEHASPVSGDVTRWNSADEDNFTQVGDLPSFYLTF